LKAAAVMAAMQDAAPCWGATKAWALVVRKVVATAG